MHDQAYQAQCRSAEQRHSPGEADRRATLILLALALGTFAIGTGEFGSNGIVQLFADDLDVSVPAATYAVTAYALGVVVGSPVAGWPMTDPRTFAHPSAQRPPWVRSQRVRSARRRQGRAGAVHAAIRV